MRESKGTIDDNVHYLPGCKPAKDNYAYAQVNEGLRNAILENECDKIRRQRTAALIYAPLLFAVGIVLGYTIHYMQTERTAEDTNTPAEQTIDK
ncbi:hypothetical protein HZC31_04850 [Candidatus Woesearchaeota archaeon]|nr:hypothetical protein [Candidatus Woesearchaeota archaeon]